MVNRKSGDVSLDLKSYFVVKKDAYRRVAQQNRRDSAVVMNIIGDQEAHISKLIQQSMKLFAHIMGFRRSSPC